jgi:hypothetical protein
MVRKPAVTLDSLAALGAEKLARIVLQEACENSAFKRRVDACLAAAKGPHALAASVDRKLLSLEKTKGQIGFGKARAFAADLNVTVRIIVDELGSTSPADAVTSLLRFVGTHECTSLRTDDEDGRLVGIYENAANALNGLMPLMSHDERCRLPEQILALSKGGQLHLREVTEIASALADIKPFINQ